MGQHKFIHDWQETKRFINLLPVLDMDEAYFVSLSARNKYLTDEEKDEISLGRTEMFSRKLIKCSFIPEKREEVFNRVIHSLECSHGGITTKTGMVIPDKCLVVYVNINPVSGKKALKLFNSKTDDMLFDSFTNTNGLYGFAGLDSLLMTCYQKSRGTKKFVDIDFDIPEDGNNLLTYFLSELIKNGVKYHVIKTKSGHHVLLETDTIKFNYTALVRELDVKAKKMFGPEHIEIIQNTNGMIPLPGTLQGGFAVHFMNI